MRKYYPKCESNDLGDKWTAGRKLQHYCRDCGWVDNPRVPEQKQVESIKTVQVGNFYGFNYEVFDKYGHLLEYSRFYNSEDEAVAELKKSLKRSNSNKNYGPCTGILWPCTVMVEGRIFKDGECNGG